MPCGQIFAIHFQTLHTLYFDVYHGFGTGNLVVVAEVFVELCCTHLGVQLDRQILYMAFLA